ncbi:MAG: response regulator [Kiritimatiellae bacterium]|nr:response regulator [Kiritimatiellia bacterium]MCO5060742.1 response regulator [Kiritimatiellia bacterium]MCO6399898.1 response regulator [Verrucomicrobiota bacterium]
MDRATILIIEDEQAIQFLLKRIVEQLGHEAILADDGQMALARLAERIPNLILTDLSLPGTPFGVDLVNALRAQVPTCPMIVTTGDLSGERVEELTRVGVEHIMGKPFDLPVAREMITSILSRNSG